MQSVITAAVFDPSNDFDQRRANVVLLTESSDDCSTVVKWMLIDGILDDITGGVIEHCPDGNIPSIVVDGKIKYFLNGICAEYRANCSKLYEQVCAEKCTSGEVKS